MSHSKELIESLISGDVAIFIGAGISMSAGLPGWIELIQPLAEAIGMKWPDNESDINASHMLTIAQHYENQIGRNALISNIQKRINLPGITPSSIHNRLIKLPVQIFLTTNYDNLIEYSLRDSNFPYHTIINESDIAFWSENLVQVVKLCGDIGRPESIVITRNDFSKYLIARPRLYERLRTILETKNVLFLGYSLQDPFLNQVWDSIGYSFGQLQKEAYAVLFNMGELELEDFRNRHIQVINLESPIKTDNTSIIAQWLDDVMCAIQSDGFNSRS